MAYTRPSDVRSRIQQLFNPVSTQQPQGYSGLSSLRLGANPYSGTQGAIYQTALEEGFDPHIAFATVENEGSYYDDLNDYYRNAGDSGMSYGPYQEHLKGRGARNPYDVDPANQTRRFIAEYRAAEAANPGMSVGQLIAAAQRPYDPIGAARKYQASYDRYAGTPTPQLSDDTGQYEGPEPSYTSALQNFNLRRQPRIGGTPIGQFGAEMEQIGRNIPILGGIAGSVADLIGPPIRNIASTIGPISRGRLEEIPEPELINPWNLLDLAGGAAAGPAKGAIAEGLEQLGKRTVGAAYDPLAEGVRRAGTRAAQGAVGRFAPQTAARQSLQAIPETDIAGERNARFILNQGDVLGGPQGVLHEDLAQQAGTSLDRLMRSGAVRIFPESGGRVAVQVTKPLSPEQSMSLSRLLSGNSEIFVETPSLSASFNDPRLAVRRIQQSFGGVNQGRQGIRQLVGAEEGFARIPEGQPTEPRLPSVLSGAKPRYRENTLTFESDIDKAAYITAQTNKSRRDAEYLNFVMRSTGMDEQAVRQYGAQVRQSIRGLEAEDGVITVPRTARPEPKAPETPASVPEGDAAQAAPDVAQATPGPAGEPPTGQFPPQPAPVTPSGAGAAFDRSPEAAARRTELIRQQRAAETPEARQQRAIAHKEADRLVKDYGINDPALRDRIFQTAIKPDPTLDEINELGAMIRAAQEGQPSTMDLLRESVENAQTNRAGGGKPPEPPAPPPEPPIAAAVPPARRDLGEGIMDIANLPRALKSSFDLSAPLRQGAYFLPSRPTEWMKAFGAMVKAIGSEKYAQAVDNSIAESPFFQQAAESGLYFAPRGGGSKIALNQREEAFMSRLANKLPWVKSSERAYTTFLNKLRMEVFETIAKEWGDGVPPENYRSLANFINAGTGRGRLGGRVNLPGGMSLNLSAEGAGPVLNAMFFSPRFFTSRIENVTNLADPVIRKQAANALWKFYGSGAAALGLMAAAGADVELDPRSSDFGKVKFGDARYDFWAGNQQIARYMAQLATGQTKPVTGKNAGKISPVDRYNPIIDFKSYNVVGNFIRSKLSPTFSVGVDIALGKDFLGEKTTAGGVAVDTLVPIFIQDLYEAGQQEGLIGALKVAPAGLGVGAQLFGSGASPASQSPIPVPRAPTAPRAPSPPRAPVRSPALAPPR